MFLFRSSNSATTLLLAVAAVLLCHLQVEAGMLTHANYATRDCSGSPSNSTQHPNATCLYGVSYTCYPHGHKCLKVNVIDLSGPPSDKTQRSRCGGKLTAEATYVCDWCTGDSEGPSTVARDCSTGAPRVETCWGGWCGSCSRPDTRHYTLGCNINGTTGYEVSVVSCGVVVLDDYIDNFRDCNGFLVQTSLPAGICFGYEKWSC